MIIIIILMPLSDNSNVSVMAGFNSLIYFILQVLFLAFFACLVIFYWMLVFINFMSLGVGYCILINSLDFSSGYLLSYLDTVELFFQLFRFFLVEQNSV